MKLLMHTHSHEEVNKEVRWQGGKDTSRAQRDTTYNFNNTTNNCLNILKNIDNSPKITLR